MRLLLQQQLLLLAVSALLKRGEAFVMISSRVLGAYARHRHLYPPHLLVHHEEREKAHSSSVNHGGGYGRRRRELVQLQAASSSSVMTAAVAVVHIVGGTLLGAPLVAHATKTWYRRIPLPAWTTPDFWNDIDDSLRYGCMGLATVRVMERLLVVAPLWQHPLLWVWTAHFALNLCWVPVFFGLQRFRLALGVNYVLITSLAVIIPLFAQNNIVSGALLLPYLGWLLYATILNRDICRLNPVDKHGYNNAMLEAGIVKLQQAAAEYAGV